MSFKNEVIAMPAQTDELLPEVKLLLEMLTYKRPAYSASEQAFLDRFIRPLQDHENVTDWWEDKHGNLFFEVCGGSKLICTAHSDTVHGRSVGAPKGGKWPEPTNEVMKQEVLFDANLDIIYKDDGECLGADDGSGMWMQIQMIEAGIPCFMVIYAAEERGGIGSSNSASDEPDFYKQFDMAIAFDRRGTTDVITHQGGSRCASDEWAQAFSDQLNRLGDGLHYSPCDGGVFTDTANLTDLIPECTNISTGYDHEHGPNETQDVDHLLRLRDAVLQVDWASLPIKRDPSVPDPDDWRNHYKIGGCSWDYGKTYPSTAKGTKPVTYLPYSGFGLDDEDVDQVDIFAPAVQEEDLYSMSEEEMIQAAEDYPVDFALAVHELIWGKKK